MLKTSTFPFLSLHKIINDIKLKQKRKLNSALNNCRDLTRKLDEVGIGMIDVKFGWYY